MTYLYKPLARKNFKTGENMFYPAPLPAAVTNFEQLELKSARSVPSRVPTLWVYSKNLNDKYSTRCFRVIPFALAHWGRFALQRSQ